MEDNDLEQPKKTKKERTPAQIEAFKKAQEIRKQNAVIKKEKIAQIKEQYKGKQPDTPVADTAPEPKPLPKPVAKVSTPVTRSQKVLEKEREEVIIVKKKKPKTRIIYETDSESEDDIPPPPKLKKEKYITPPQVQRFYPNNQRHTPFGVFAII